MAAFNSSLHRRNFLLGLSACCAAAPAFAAAPEAEFTLADLIVQAQGLRGLSERIDFIGWSLRGRPYQANTLIGASDKPEVMVTREDRFDCVTFCEAVLAAAKSQKPADYADHLRMIRYRGGVVEWRERNHDCAAWCARNIENGQCLPIALAETVEVEKVIAVPKALGTRTYTLDAIPRAELLGQSKALLPGDLIGFVSRQVSLDYFHTGFIAFSGKGELLLRHASQSHGKVVDQKMSEFCAANRVRFVTLLRPVEAAA